VDEAGRGPLAGPVVAAAVIMPRDRMIHGVNDSKMLLPREREELFPRIMESAVTVGIGVVDHTEIDRVNILNASFQAMQKAIDALVPVPDHLLIDGNRFLPGGAAPSIPNTLVIGGDARSFSIAAASIIAKVTRDRLMSEFDLIYPGYGFARHKGYATPEHRDAIFRLGYCDIHRRSFCMKQQMEIPFDTVETGHGDPVDTGETEPRQSTERTTRYDSVV
jgi:ribonuclease HII